jgi:hypothetical protein
MGDEEPQGFFIIGFDGLFSITSSGIYSADSDTVLIEIY